MPHYQLLKVDTLIRLIYHVPLQEGSPGKMDTITYPHYLLAARPKAEPAPTRARISGPRPVTSNLILCSISSPCSKLVDAPPPSYPTTSSLKVERVRRCAKICSRSATYTRCSVSPQASSMPRESKPTSSSSTKEPVAQPPRQKSYGSTTCAPTKTSLCAPTHSGQKTSKTSLPPTIPKTVTSARKVNVSNPIATTNCSNATNSASISSGSATKVRKAPIRSNPWKNSPSRSSMTLKTPLISSTPSPKIWASQPTALPPRNII